MPATVGNRTYQKRGSVETCYAYDEVNQLQEVHEVRADAWTYFASDGVDRGPGDAFSLFMNCAIHEVRKHARPRNRRPTLRILPGT